MNDNKDDNRSPGQKAYDDAQAEAFVRDQLAIWDKEEKERQVSEELWRAIGKTIQGH
jgi:hypothetical protein